MLALLGGYWPFAVFGGVATCVATAAFAGSFPCLIPAAVARSGGPRQWTCGRAYSKSCGSSPSSLGRSIPQSLFEVGRRCSVELRPAFQAAEREWLLSTDFPRTLRVLKAGLADPTADAACETLLVAHEVGGTDLDRRLEALIDDRIQDTQGRKDARAKQAGARFARRFVLIVPAGMALAGMSVGTGRAAYQKPRVRRWSSWRSCWSIVCWLWAGRIMSCPKRSGVFDA